MITAAQVSFAYGDHAVLESVDLTASQDCIVGLVGPNGSGKTTLLRTLYASLKAQSGNIVIDTDELRSLSAREIAKRIAVVVQESAGDLPLLVSDMVLLGRTPHRSGFSRRGADDDEVAAAALKRVGALELADKPFDSLSGGERQRVLFARALAQEASHLLLDEPTNHLDIRYQHEILQLIRSLATDGGSTVIVVLHDLNLAAQYCDRIVLLNQGHVVSDGGPSEVLVAENLEPVYQVHTHRISLEDGFQLAFRPLDTPSNVRT